MKKLDRWQQETDLDKKIWALWDEGVCPFCEELSVGGIFTDVEPVYEDDLFLVTVASKAVNPGETFLTYKPHRPDMSALDSSEISVVGRMCVDLMNAVKKGLGVDKVYLVTMCDGLITHLHYTLVPRHEGDYWGITRFDQPRKPFSDAKLAAKKIGDCLRVIRRTADLSG